MPPKQPVRWGRAHKWARHQRKTLCPSTPVGVLARLFPKVRGRGPHSKDRSLFFLATREIPPKTVGWGRGPRFSLDPFGNPPRVGKKGDPLYGNPLGPHTPQNGPLGATTPLIFPRTRLGEGPHKNVPPNPLRSSLWGGPWERLTRPPWFPKEPQHLGGTTPFKNPVSGKVKPPWAFQTPGNWLGKSGTPQGERAP